MQFKFQYLWKPALIIGILAGAVAIWAAKGLNPGIDLAGGTTLVYDVKVPKNSNRSQVIDDTIAILKQRVDPTGTKNLLWRPVAGSRIEVQMPLPPPEVAKRRQTYLDARDKLKTSNLSKRAVTAAIELPEAKRAKRLKSLADGDDELLSELQAAAKAKDQLESARKPLRQAEKAHDQAQGRLKNLGENASDKKKARLSKKAEQTLDTVIAASKKFNDAQDHYQRALGEALTSNVSLQDWERIRQLKNDPREAGKDAQGNQAPTPRQAAITQLKQEHPGRAAQIQKIADAYEAYEQVKGPLADPNDLIKLLQGSGVLELRMAADPRSQKLRPDDIQAYRDQLREKGPQAGSDKNWHWYQIANIQRWLDNDTDRIERFRENPQAFAKYMAQPGAYSRNGLVAQGYGGRFYLLLGNNPKYAMTRNQKWELTSVSRSQDQLMRPAVGFKMDARGQGLLASLTRKRVGQNMAVLLDNQIITAPNLRSALDQGGGQITGDFSNDEFLHLIRSMKAGSLEGQLGEYPISIRTTGPQLGEDNLQAGIEASVIALIAVAAFMAIYYFFAGMVADFALAANMVIILGVMSLVEATFTLPGIAGMVLTIGMAVDANVLIFERIREEMTAGADMPTSVRLGFGKALSTILDANITTLITCLVLGYTATAEVKGFAVVLGIGILATLFTALFCSRVIFDFYVRFFPATPVHMLPTVSKGLGRLLSPKIDWIGLRGIFFTVSALSIIVGVIFVIERGKSMLDIEFRSGTKVTFNLKKQGPGQAGQQPTPTGQSSTGSGESPATSEPSTGSNSASSANAGSTTPANPSGLSKANAQAQARANARAGAQQIRLPISEVRQRIETYAQVGLALQKTGKAPADTDPQIAAAMKRILDNAQARYKKAMDDWRQAKASNAKLEQKPELADFILLKHPSVVTQGDKVNGKAPGFSISTLMTDSQAVSAVIKAAFGDVLNTTQPIGFAKADIEDFNQAPVRRVSSTQLSRVLNENLPGNDQAYDLSQYLGGVAIVLREIEPAPTLDELRQRIKRMRQQPSYESLGYRDAKVVGLDVAFTDKQGQQHYNGAVVVVTDNQTNYVQHPGTFANNNGLAVTEWNLVHDALQRGTSLASVTKFSSQVSGTMQQRAIAALILSLLAVVGYIWLRFGSVRYGLAAIVALIHDVSITLGFLALCGWLYDTGFGHDLLLSNFKIDLALIAALLTIIGYSLNDTIVVFDRIRENRGRLAHLSHQIINDSINQTFSRTMLTSGTTLMAIAVLYLFGGPGIHGFAFAMLMGVLVGTYSSVAIASPLLLIGGGGGKKAKAQATTRQSELIHSHARKKPTPAASTTSS